MMILYYLINQLISTLTELFHENKVFKFILKYNLDYVIAQ